MNDFAPFILMYISEHQFTSTVFVSKMCVTVTFHFSFHFNVLFVHFLFSVDVEEGPAYWRTVQYFGGSFSVSTFSYWTYFTKSWVVVFLFHHLCKYTSTCTPTTQLKCELCYCRWMFLCNKLTFISSLGLSQFYATCRAKWDTPGLELFFARVGLLPNLPHNKDLQ